MATEFNAPYYAVNSITDKCLEQAILELQKRSRDNPYFKALLRCCKYRPDWPQDGLASVDNARHIQRQNAKRSTTARLCKHQHVLSGKTRITSRTAQETGVAA